MFMSNLIQLRVTGRHCHRILFSTLTDGFGQRYINIEDIPDIESLDLRPPRSVRADYTRDALAKLQSYTLETVRLRSSSSSSQMETKVALEDRLLHLIAGSMNLPPENEHVAQKHATIIDTLKCRKHPISKTSSTGFREDKQDAKKNAERVQSKEHTLEKTMKQTLSLLKSSNEQLRELNLFNTSTIPSLKVSLEEDKDAALGYIDTLTKSLNKCPSFVGAPNTVATSRGKSISRFKEDLTRDIVQAHETHEFLSKAVLNTFESSSEVSEKICDHLREREGTTTTQTRRLQNTISKSKKVGNGLVRDIETLLKEVDLITKGALS
ncbi:hypothetical protein QCA50_012417 [Cerrena zonata]|uniref:Uncharacterized protein n=1 Tax=Cerrena zonata TaxID=2478898 RepID=A0AAW0G028_9APHY